MTQVKIKEPKFNVICTIDAEGCPTESFVFEGEKPKELMDQFQTFLGDGKASVTVSTDMGVKKFGNGVSAMVAVTLSCGQDTANLTAAMELAAQVGRHYVKIYQHQAEEELRNMLRAQNRPIEF